MPLHKNVKSEFIQTFFDIKSVSFRFVQKPS